MKHGMAKYLAPVIVLALSILNAAEARAQYKVVGGIDGGVFIPYTSPNNGPEFFLAGHFTYQFFTPYVHLGAGFDASQEHFGGLGLIARLVLPLGDHVVLIPEGTFGPATKDFDSYGIYLKYGGFIGFPIGLPGIRSKLMPTLGFHDTRFFIAGERPFSGVVPTIGLTFAGE